MTLATYFTEGQKWEIMGIGGVAWKWKRSGGTEKQIIKREMSEGGRGCMEIEKKWRD